MTGVEIAGLARGWIGTPYRHQASCKGAGTDCLGLVRGVWREAYGAEPELPPAYTPDWGEAAAREVLREAAGRHLVARIDAAEPEAGDVLLFRMRAGVIAKHLGIAISGDRFIHAYARHGVIENALSAPWRRRVAAIFSFPDRA